MRVVFDTNAIFSALLFASGHLSWLPTLWMQEAITPLVSRETVGELIRVLAYPKFDLSSEDIKAVLDAYLPYAEIVAVPAEPASNLPVCRDQND